MNVCPMRHSVNFGEMVRWVPLPAAARFFVWRRVTAAGAAPTWVQVSGWNLNNQSRIDIALASEHAHLLPTVQPSQTGVLVAWQGLISIFDGFNPEVLMVTAERLDASLLSMDRYRLPSPNSTDAETIAAQERQFLEHLLAQRVALAQVSSGHARVKDPSGTEYELQDLNALDRRIAEVRARIVWFDTAAAGNALPRAEHW